MKKRGLFIPDMVEGYTSPYRCLMPGTIVEILSFEPQMDMRWGEMLNVRVRRDKYSWDVTIPERTVLVLSGKAYFAEFANIEKEMALKKNTEITRLCIANTISTKKVEIVPVCKKKLAEKLWLIFDQNGCLYVMQDLVVSSGYLGYMGVGSMPEIGKRYYFTSLLSFGQKSTKRRMYDNFFTEVTAIKQLAKNFFAISGRIKGSDLNKHFIITAYVQVKKLK